MCLCSDGCCLMVLGSVLIGADFNSGVLWGMWVLFCCGGCF